LLSDEYFIMPRRTYRRFSREFKLEAVRQVVLGEKPKTQIARALEIRVGQLRHWQLRFEEEVLTGFTEPLPADDQDLEQLRRENVKLKVENEILRKAAIYKTNLQAIRIIRAEHRSLAAVLDGMLYFVHQIRDRGVEPDFNLLGAMIYYFDTVPERFHHPKEDEYLFHFLRLRRPDAAPLLERLKSEHRIGAEKVCTLALALTRYQQGGAAEFANFMTAVEAYASFQWKHMGTEEKELLPLAEKHLTAPDWEVIDAAFLGHTDPLLGAKAGSEYEALFGRIFRLAPPPIGMGPMR
jgi:branched-chain amino acid transport system ATP-binding protein